jgi:MFS superfamily sulfate permease-like transporter
LLVGIFQILIGSFRLGFIINFLSHPVINGFTNAAALIIATSQLPKIFGVSVEKGEHHYQTVINVIIEAFSSTHVPTLLFAVFSFVIMFGLRKLFPRIPYVLIHIINK